MPWIIFLISSAIVVAAAVKLAEYGDVISVRTKLGGLLVGTIFLAGATSLPEMIASITSFSQGLPDLAAGNFFGSNMVNMLLLALVDMFSFQVPLLRRAAITHTLTMALGALLMVVAIIFVLLDVPVPVLGWVGVDSLLLIALYFGGLWLIQQEGKLASRPSATEEVVPGADFPSLRKGVLGFAAAALVLMFIVPELVKATADIAEITGLGTTFVGTALLSLVTSLPELLAAIAAVRLGAYDLAIGNLFGSNIFNMLGLGLADFFYTEGRFLGDIDPSFALVGLLGLLLMIMALIGNLARIERRIFYIEVDAVLMILVYLAGMYLLFIQGRI
ncbi:MAG: sodium:calcium antiporter [Chloroflexi bacterium]|nr:sodium:calcium antiporter [Chloroflexota bacterium]MBP8057329.1 sodium:calcium antiporter [Chloroflexota bacterium]